MTRYLFAVAAAFALAAPAPAQTKFLGKDRSDWLKELSGGDAAAGCRVGRPPRTGTRGGQAGTRASAPPTVPRRVSAGPPCWPGAAARAAGPTGRPESGKGRPPSGGTPLSLLGSGTRTGHPR